MSNKGEEPPSEYELRRERSRERIATAVLQGMAMADRTQWDERGPLLVDKAARAVEWADALMAELDKPDEKAR